MFRALSREKGNRQSRGPGEVIKSKLETCLKQGGGWEGNGISGLSIRTAGVAEKSTRGFKASGPSRLGSCVSHKNRDESGCFWN